MDGSRYTRVLRTRVDPLIAGLVVVCLIAPAGFGFGSGSRLGRLVVFWLMMAVVHLIFMVSAARLARSARDADHEPKATTRLWRLITFTAATLLAGDVLQLAEVYRAPDSPAAVYGTGPQMALLGVGMLALLYGFVRYPLGGRRGGGRSRLNLDLATVMAGATTFGLWGLHLPPGDRGWGWVLNLVLTLLLQPGLFLAAIFLVLKVVLSDRSPFTRTAGPMVVVSTLSVGAIQAVPLYTYLSADLGPWLMAWNVVGSALLTISVRVQEIQVRTEQAGRETGRPYSALPYGAMVATWALALVTLLTHGLTWLSWGVLGGTVVTTALVVTRQVAAFRHIAELLHERDTLTARLTQLAYHDPLTGLPNRALFLTRLTDALASGPVTVFLIDLDDFKPVNDRYGHAAGDLLLIEAADRLRALVREGETPSRLGGDEFAVLIEGEAADRLPELIQALRGTVMLGDTPVALQASVGVAQAIGGSPDAVLHRADMAMYAMKHRSDVQVP